MKDRIKEYIEYKEISAGDLAVTLEVQRSNISHILNGRNKPGASFIQKLLLSYPDLNARWLLTGEGNMLDSKDADWQTVATKVDKAKSISSIDYSSLTDASVEKIILLYTDGTFTTYSHK